MQYLFSFCLFQSFLNTINCSFLSSKFRWKFSDTCCWVYLDHFLKCLFIKWSRFFQKSGTQNTEMLYYQCRLAWTRRNKTWNSSSIILVLWPQFLSKSLLRTHLTCTLRKSTFLSSSVHDHKLEWHWFVVSLS